MRKVVPTLQQEHAKPPAIAKRPTALFKSTAPKLAALDDDCRPLMWSDRSARTLKRDIEAWHRSAHKRTWSELLLSAHHAHEWSTVRCFAH